MKTLLKQIITCTLVWSLASIVWASDVTLPNTFQSGTPAVAAQVNDNFSAVKSAVDDNDGRIAALEATIASLQTTITDLQNRLAAVEGNSVLALDGYLTRDVDDYGYDRALFSGLNVQVINGETQDTINGLGNLIVGYNNPHPFSNDKSGSHNLVTGDEHHYSSYGGFLAGWRNISNNIFTSVSGGEYNTASGEYTSVSGGSSNTASGFNSSVSGGIGNTSSASGSSVSGGIRNTASGFNSSVSGGWNNTASGLDSSVSGGINNTASGDFSSVSGGTSNVATGENSSVSGGNTNEARGQNSTVGGGANDLAPGIDDWRAGIWFSDN